MSEKENLVAILFLAADPTDTARLRLGQELRDIRERLQLSKNREKFILESRESVRPGDVTQAIFDVNPHIIHFSGHGTQSGELCLEDSQGTVQPVTPVALSALFKLVSDRVSCVVLNACYSRDQAKAISQHIPYVIGMSKEIGDRAAITFSVGFYKALAAERSIPEAHNFGCAELLLQGIQEHLTPILLTQAQFNQLQARGCDEEDSLRSVNGNVRTSIRFINKTDSTVKVYWIDYQGKRQHYFDLRANETHDQVTYVTHPWIVTKAGDKRSCLGIFLPNKENGVVILD